MKKFTAVLGAALVVVGLAGCSSASIPAASSATATTASVAVPDLAGKDGATARDELTAAGLVVTFKSDSGQAVVAASNWTVVSTEPAGGASVAPGASVTVNVTKSQSTPEASAQDATSTGLTGTYAQAACDSYAKTQFPYGYNPAWILGRLADQIENDKWFFKVEAKVKNEYNAKRDIVIECTVGGTNDAPSVESFNAY